MPPRQPHAAEALVLELGPDLGRLGVVGGCVEDDELERQVLRAAGFTEMSPDPPVEELDLIDLQLRPHAADARSAGRG